ncbi:unnamed protein product [Dibothriocephalus latus]|uniref:Secreted protein n=1 Tax=Dibothriocephalus latus TaxID=60516 RepID=A0A3P7KXX9_DIBLA|nr:unnamed protein product [Dibothriocephalus latus]
MVSFEVLSLFVCMPLDVARPCTDKVLTSNDTEIPTVVLLKHIEPYQWNKICEFQEAVQKKKKKKKKKKRSLEQEVYCSNVSDSVGNP